MLTSHTACSGQHTRHHYGYYSVITHSAIPRAITAVQVGVCAHSNRRGYSRKSELLQPLQYREGHSCLSAREHHLTSRDVCVDISQLGKEISETCKAGLPDCTERYASNVSAHDAHVSRIPFRLLHQPRSNKAQLLRSWHRDHQARPVVPIARKVASAKPSERQAHPLS